jgi:ankyrin repeat protein
MTALHIASHFGFLNIVMSLLSMGADPNECDLFHSTSLHFAAANGHFSSFSYFHFFTSTLAQMHSLMLILLYDRLCGSG